MPNREVTAIEESLHDHWDVIGRTWQGGLPLALGWYTQAGNCGRPSCATCQSRPGSEHPHRDEFWDRLGTIERGAEPPLGEEEWPRSVVVQDTYARPPDGWVCFHCGERFTSYGSAEDHFGAQPEDTAACLVKVGEERGLVMGLRRAEARIRELENNECAICGQKLANKRALANHKWLAHRIRGD